MAGAADERDRRGGGSAGGGANPDALLGLLTLVELDEPVRRLAGAVGPASLRCLDAIYLATALSLGADVGGFCCYDRRLAADAEAAGLVVIAPGLH